ncbi:MAG: V-type ATP synthase subunit E [Clostridia bacterium]|nr:V-type ATP synthase subunit E [Clostridia bacterium]
MANDGLNNFANVLLQEAKDQKASELAKLEAQRTLALKRADETCKQRLEQALHNGTSELEYQRRKILTQRKIELKRLLLQTRQGLCEELFTDLEQQVRAFTKTEHYKMFLQRAWNRAEPYFRKGSGEVICTVMASDMELAKELFPMPGLKFVHSEKDLIGGFLLENATLRLFVDYTLLARIAEQKEEFRKTNALLMED